jgi:hypothetical protein
LTVVGIRVDPRAGCRWSRGSNPGGEDITHVTARAIDDRGLVSWSVELPPLGRRAVTLEYRVKSQRDVAGV